MGGTNREQQISTKLEQAVRRARIMLYWERLWPRIWLPLGVAGAFVVLSWLGLWTLLPAGGRMAGVLLSALLLVASVVPAIAVRYPTRRDALRALDLDANSDYAPDPASVLTDKQALGQADPASRALWALHRRRAEAAVEHLRVRLPRPATAQFDLYGLRGALIVALVAAGFIAGGERSWRFGLAFDWRSGATGEQVASRTDGWIDPPAYTRLPPVMLDLTRAGQREVSVPVGSTLVLRFAGQRSAHREGEVEASGGLKAQPLAQAGSDGIVERRYTITGPADISLRTEGGQARLTIAAIPDNPPNIAFVDAPEATRRGGLTITFKAGDDYGVTEAQGVIALPGEEVDQALVPAPVIALPLPRTSGETQELRTTADLAAHPWAGALVDLTLVARDGAGQEGHSETIKLTLPQRPFNNPLAKALIEQRRNLVFHPQDWRDVRLALRALKIEPDLFTPQASIYLGLVTAEKMLSRARKQTEFVAVVDYLWGMALAIEDGDAAGTEAALQAAQKALQDAIDRNAPEQEISRLAQELREALNRHLSEMARNQTRNRDSAQRDNAPTRTITPEELAKMIDRMEQMARDGDVAGAQRLMEQLRDILDNLQTAQGGEPSQGSQTGEAGRALRSLDNMIRNQQRLRDDTYQQNGAAAEGEAPQPGQPSQQGEGGQDLSGRQETLRRQLERLQRGLADQGMSTEPGLDAAERAMREAEENLAQGDGEGAVDAQGRALEALLNGAQGLAQQMRQAQSGENGEQGSQQQQAGEGEKDPLGRSTGKRWSDSDTRVPGADESAIVRARRILDELRRRLGDPNRSVEERDYLERLLRRQ